MAKKSNGKFQGLIDQMNKDRHHLILVSLDSAPAFRQECKSRGYDIATGDEYNGSVVLYKK